MSTPEQNQQTSPYGGDFNFWACEWTMSLTQPLAQVNGSRFKNVEELQSASLSFSDAEKLVEDARERHHRFGQSRTVAEEPSDEYEVAHLINETRDLGLDRTPESMAVALTIALILTDDDKDRAQAQSARLSASLQQ